MKRHRFIRMLKEIHLYTNYMGDISRLCRFKDEFFQDNDILAIVWLNAFIPWNYSKIGNTYRNLVNSLLFKQVENDSILSKEHIQYAIAFSELYDKRE